jgi:hypothetical protein
MHGSYTLAVGDGTVLVDRLKQAFRDDIDIPALSHNFLSAPGGGEGRVRWGIPERLATTHLTLPSLHDGPLPLPPEAGGEGQIPERVDAAPEIV